MTFSISIIFGLLFVFNPVLHGIHFTTSETF